MIRRGALAGLLGAVLAWAPQPAAARRDWAGRYRVAEGPDVAGGLELKPDGRFAYVLIAGALDEQAQGSWREDGEVVLLTTEPTPRPPAFAPAPAASDAAQGPLRLSVVWPNGTGIALVDFRIGFDAGEPLEGYTQDDGWEAPEDERRQPRWIELAVPMHGLISPRFEVAPGQRALRFVLTPNDLGVVDFRQAAFARDGKGFALLHPRGGKLRFARTGE